MEASKFNSANPAKANLIGYFGHRNLGDDLMLDALLDAFEASPAVASVTVDMYEDTRGQWAGKIRPLTGARLSGKARRLAGMLRANCVVWGGGTCLYHAPDNTGMVRLLRYVRLAKALGKPFYFVNIGIGRLDSEEATALATAILREAAGVSFRDENSYAIAQRLAPSSHFSMGGDLAALCALPIVQKKTDGVIRTIAFSGVREALERPDVVRAVARSLGSLVHQGIKIAFIPFHGGEHSDHVFHKAVARDLPPACYALAEVNTVQDAVDQLSQADFHIGMRLHSVVVADLMGLPGIGLAFHPKVSYYAERQSAGERLALPEAGFGLNHIQAVLASYTRPTQALGQERAAALAGLRRFIPA